jgi:DNA-binding NarL/FixJ family response regulator
MARAIIANGKGDPLKQIRILLARMPKMLLDILSHVVASEFDMMVAGLVEDDEDLLAAARRTRANVLLVEQTAEDEREKYRSLLLGRPKLKVVAVSGNGRTGKLYELRPHRVLLGEMSADALRRAIRGQARTITHPLREH